MNVSHTRHGTLGAIGLMAGARNPWSITRRSVRVLQDLSWLSGALVMLLSWRCLSLDWRSVLALLILGSLQYCHRVALVRLRGLLLRAGKSRWVLRIRNGLGNGWLRLRSSLRL